MPPFVLWAALDLLGGRVVRLRQGDFAAVTAFDEPVEGAVARAARFAHGMHVVDLDGARDGEAANDAPLRAILAAAPVPVQVGGGVRSVAALRRVLDAGAVRVVLGSRAVEEPAFLDEAVAAVGATRVVLGLDLRDGRPAVRGWTAASARTSEAVLDDALAAGVEMAVVTDIRTDGMLGGPNVALVRRLAAAYPSLAVIASGGVARVADLDALRAAGAAGAVFGRAWLDGTLDPDDLAAFARSC